jgi:hypothetical protein
VRGPFLGEENRLLDTSIYIAPRGHLSVSPQPVHDAIYGHPLPQPVVVTRSATLVVDPRFLMRAEDKSAYLSIYRIAASYYPEFRRQDRPTEYETLTRFVRVSLYLHDHSRHKSDGLPRPTPLRNYNPHSAFAIGESLFAPLMQDLRTQGARYALERFHSHHLPEYHMMADRLLLPHKLDRQDQAWTERSDFRTDEPSGAWALPGWTSPKSPEAAPPVVHTYTIDALERLEPLPPSQPNEFSAYPPPALEWYQAERILSEPDRGAKRPRLSDRATAIAPPVALVTTTPRRGHRIGLEHLMSTT